MKYTPLFLDKLRKKDEKAYQKLYDDFFPSLVAFANKYVYDDSLSEDIVQEVLITLWQNSTKINIHTSIKSYLYSAVRNSAINYLEKKTVEEKRKEGYLFSGYIYNSEDKEFAFSQDVYYHLHNAIKHLPKKSREVIIMSLNEMSLSEIQEELNVSINTVKTNKRRAYAMLREKLKKIFLISIILLFGIMH
ncbi:MAG: RNA polymerase sigma-70 factor [Marinifilum sp.]|jgi:RNA polymerase sigma-70 factor (ECF subfamily)|nr:RNA polymerase sigma-70 factor [Marinifilum sp.]